MLKGLIEGRVVHYVLSAEDVPSEFTHCIGKHRPAIVVNALSELEREDGVANLTVLMDWERDGNFRNVDGINVFYPCYEAPTRCYSEDKEPGTWHWVETTATTNPVEYVRKDDFDAAVEAAVTRLINAQGGKRK